MEFPALKAGKPRIELARSGRHHSQTGNPDYIPPEYCDIPELLDELAAMGNAGLSYNYKDLATVPDGLVERVHAKGVKMCLRAGDTPETVAAMVKMGLDYIPTNVTIPM
jgi:hypothetical protein